MTDSMTTPTAGDAAAPHPTWLDRLCRQSVLNVLGRLSEGQVQLADGDRVTTFGRLTPDFDRTVTIAVHSPRFYRMIAYGGATGAGTAYIDGAWTCSDITTLTRIFIRNRPALESAERGWSHIGRLLLKAYHGLRRNTRSGSRRNISDHYDMGNDLFAQVLDETMNYSSGIFEHPESTLADASRAKMDRICRKLDLRSSDHLVEVGTGWGGLAIHAASQYGCRVTTATISREQHELASRRVRDAGLDHRIRVLLTDYRDLRGAYDKLVSVEMIEAVGAQYLDTYFEACANLLRSDGLALIQAITIGDQQFARSARNVDYIKRYVFPGSCLPSVTRMCEAVARRTDLRPVHLEDITPHYVETLRCWRENTNRNRDRIRALGYTERFLRMWDYYLGYCEGGFAERYIGDVQLVLAKPRNTRPPILADIGPLESQRVTRP